MIRPGAFRAEVPDQIKFLTKTRRILIGAKDAAVRRGGTRRMSSAAGIASRVPTRRPALSATSWRSVLMLRVNGTLWQFDAAVNVLKTEQHQ